MVIKEEKINFVGRETKAQTRSMSSDNIAESRRTMLLLPLIKRVGLIFNCNNIERISQFYSKNKLRVLLFGQSFAQTMGVDWVVVKNKSDRREK